MTHTLRFTQTGEAGPQLQHPLVAVFNRQRALDTRDPDNPVAFGWSTELIVRQDCRWQLRSLLQPGLENLQGAGAGSSWMALPVGQYEITIDIT